MPIVIAWPVLSWDHSNYLLLHVKTRMISDANVLISMMTVVPLVTLLKPVLKITIQLVHVMVSTSITVQSNQLAWMKTI